MYVGSLCKDTYFWCTLKKESLASFLTLWKDVPIATFKYIHVRLRPSIPFRRLLTRTRTAQQHPPTAAASRFPVAPSPPQLSPGRLFPPPFSRPNGRTRPHGHMLTGSCRPFDRADIEREPHLLLDHDVRLPACEEDHLFVGAEECSRKLPLQKLVRAKNPRRTHTFWSD